MPSHSLRPFPRHSRAGGRPSRTGARLVATLVVLATVGAACGGDDGGPTDATDDTVVSDLDLEPVEEDGRPDATDDGAVDGLDDGCIEQPRPVVEVPDDVPTELEVTDLLEGTGPAARSGDSVVVDYVGVVTTSGVQFDSSWDRDLPFSVRLGEGRVIAGWDEGLVGVQTGGRRQIDIPAEMAYGDNPPGGSAIDPGDALTFVVDVCAVIESVDPADEPDLAIEPSIGRSELGIDDVEVGEGAELEAGQTAIAHLMLLRGDDLEVLESTWRFDDPAQIVMAPGGAIDGLVEGLAGMRVGGLRVISIPPALAFGPEGVPAAGLSGDTDVIIVARLVGLY